MNGESRLCVFHPLVVFGPPGELGSVYQTPCVVFTGHPTLRCGDAVHFMETWGSSNKNAVIFTGEKDGVFRD